MSSRTTSRAMTRKMRNFAAYLGIAFAAILLSATSKVSAQSGAQAAPVQDQQNQQQLWQLQLQRPAAASDQQQVIAEVPIVGYETERQLAFPSASESQAQTYSASHQRPTVIYSGFRPAGPPPPYAFGPAGQRNRRQLRGYQAIRPGQPGGVGFRPRPPGLHRHVHKHIGGEGLSGAGGLVAYNDDTSAQDNFGDAEFAGLFGNEGRGQGGRGQDPFFSENGRPDPFFNVGGGRPGQQGGASEDVEYGDPDDPSIDTIGDVDVEGGDGEGDGEREQQAAGDGGSNGGRNPELRDGNGNRVRRPVRNVEAGDASLDIDTDPDLLIADGGGAGGEGGADADDDDGGIELDDVNGSLSENEILDVVTLFNERRHAQDAADEEEGAAADSGAAPDELIVEPLAREDMIKQKNARSAAGSSRAGVGSGAKSPTSSSTVYFSVATPLHVIQAPNLAKEKPRKTS